MCGNRAAANRILLGPRDMSGRDYAQPLSIETLAAAAALSRAHFIRRFRDAFGETSSRYLQRRRLERARDLLRISDKPITQTLRHSAPLTGTSIARFSPPSIRAGRSPEYSVEVDANARRVSAAGTATCRHAPFR